MFNPTQILDLVSSFQTRAQSIKRYEGNPYVIGDNIAEHIARAVRMLVYIIPQLQAEFPDHQHLIEDALATIILHDDDEIIDGFDIPTSEKIHNTKDAEEVAKFAEAVACLDTETATYLSRFFSSFRHKDSLPARIAKTIDNIVGNQLVVEQRIGLVNPDSARFALEYVQKVKGVSHTTDALADAQIKKIIDGREALRHDKVFLKTLPPHTPQLLAIDIRSHVLDIKKVNTPLEKLV